MLSSSLKCPSFGWRIIIHHSVTTLRMKNVRSAEFVLTARPNLFWQTGEHIIWGHNSTIITAVSRRIHSVVSDRKPNSDWLKRVRETERSLLAHIIWIVKLWLHPGIKFTRTLSLTILCLLPLCWLHFIVMGECWFVNWPPHPEGKETPKKESGHSRLEGGSRNKQENLRRRVVLSNRKTSSPPYPLPES